MANSTESRDLHGVNPSNESLSPVEIDQQAFGLIGEFKGALRNFSPFTDKVPDLDLYFGESKDGDPTLISGGNRAVNFSIADVIFGTSIIFNKGGHAFRLARRFFDSEQSAVIEESVLLQSRRFESQEPSSSAVITYSHSRPLESVSRPMVIRNMPLAVEKARGMLAGLSPQK